MRKFVTLALVIYFTLVVVVLVGGFMIKYHSDSKPAETTSAPSQVENPPASNEHSQQTTSDSKAYTAADVAPHNTAKDCWLIIENQVFNVTQFLVEHPGGINMIMPYCGKEATEAFRSKGGSGGVHSQSALALKQQYYIGNLK